MSAHNAQEVKPCPDLRKVDHNPLYCPHCKPLETPCEMCGCFYCECGERDGGQANE